MIRFTAIVLVFSITVSSAYPLSIGEFLGVEPETGSKKILQELNRLRNLESLKWENAPNRDISQYSVQFTGDSAQLTGMVLRVYEGGSCSSSVYTFPLSQTVTLSQDTVYTSSSASNYALCSGGGNTCNSDPACLGTYNCYSYRFSYDVTGYGTVQGDCHNSYLLASGGSACAGSSDCGFEGSSNSDTIDLSVVRRKFSR